MNRVFGALSRNVVRYRWLVILFWIALAIVSTKTLPSLGNEVNNDNSQFLPASAPSSVAGNLAAPVLGNPNLDSSLTIVAATSHGTLSVADQAALVTLSKAEATVHGVNKVQVLAESPNAKAEQLLVSAKVNQADITRQTTLVDALQATLRHANLPPNLTAHLAGPVATNVANQKSSSTAGSKTQGLTFVFIIILLLLIFRSLLAPLMTLLPAAFALIVSMRFIGGLGAHGLQISEITELLLIVLLLGAGTDYGLFLVFRVREEIQRGLEPRDAVIHSLERVGESITASAGTVIFALLSLLFATFGIYHDLGIPLALGIAVMLLTGLTLLPALLAVSGRALFWPSRIVRGSSNE